MNKHLPQYLPVRYAELLIAVATPEHSDSQPPLQQARELCAARKGLPDGYMSLDSFIELVEILCSFADAPWLGYHYGKRLMPTSHGALGGALMTCGTVGEILQTAARYAHAYLPLTVSLDRDSKNFTLGASFSELPREQLEFHVQVAVSGQQTVLTEIIGSLPANVLVKFPFAFRPGYQDRFHGQLEFDAHELSISYPVTYANIPVPGADPISRTLFLKNMEVAGLQLQQSKTIGTRVLQILNSVDDHESYPTMEQVSESLHITSRTLRTHLSEENLSFRTMIKQHRLEKAKQLLRGTSLDVAEISSLIGYQESANFCRAFQAEFGRSPASFRKLIDP